MQQETKYLAPNKVQIPKRSLVVYEDGEIEKKNDIVEFSGDGEIAIDHSDGSLEYICPLDVRRILSNQKIDWSIANINFLKVASTIAVILQETHL